MNEEHIKKVKQILTTWNPLGNRANEISDLNNYQTEAIDILFHVSKNHSVGQIATLTKTVLNQAFNLEISKEEAKPYAKMIHKAIKE